MQDFDEKIKKYLYYFGFGGKMLLFAQLCDRNFGGNAQQAESESTTYKKRAPEGSFYRFRRIFNGSTPSLYARCHRRKS